MHPLKTWWTGQPSYYDLFSTPLKAKLCEDQVLHYNALPASCTNCDLRQNKYFLSMVINVLKLKTLPLDYPTAIKTLYISVPGVPG